MALYLTEGTKESLALVLRLLEAAVVRRMFSGGMPHLFGRVEFRPAGRQLDYLQITSLLGKPLVGFLLFVVRDVVLNQEHTMARR